MTITTFPHRRGQCQQAEVNDDASVVRRFFRAWVAGDVSGLDTLVDVNVVLGPILGLLYEREVYTGREDVANAFREVAARWDRFELSVEETRQAGDHVVAILALVVEKHGMSSVASVTVGCRLRDGLIVSVTDDEG